ncbi:MAG: hypothetical protein Q7S33_01020 [Nanoarchaeota archaeon]|nr:hypothetical protein [Nanoarchaeota archaeon]
MNRRKALGLTGLLFASFISKSSEAQKYNPLSINNSVCSPDGLNIFSDKLFISKIQKDYNPPTKEKIKQVIRGSILFGAYVYLFRELSINGAYKIPTDYKD